MIEATVKEKLFLEKIKSLLEKHDDILYKRYTGEWRINIDENNFIEGGLSSIRMNKEVMLSNFSEEFRAKLKGLAGVFEEKSRLKKDKETEELFTQFLNL